MTQKEREDEDKRIRGAIIDHLKDCNPTFSVTLFISITCVFCGISLLIISIKKLTLSSDSPLIKLSACCCNSDIINTSFPQFLLYTFILHLSIIIIPFVYSYLNCIYWNFWIFNIFYCWCYIKLCIFRIFYWFWLKN